jgi:Zn-dependent protease with chaperone function
MTARHVLATALMCLLLVAFATVWALVLHHAHGASGVALFAAAFGLFRLMNRFERSREEDG